MANRNRTAGLNYERKIIKDLKELKLFPAAVSSRAESKNMDDKGVDICNTPGFYIQCKNSKTNPRYDVLLEEMPQEPGIINAVIHQKTKKANTKFIAQGEYVVVKKADFYRLLCTLKSLTK